MRGLWFALCLLAGLSLPAAISPPAVRPAAAEDRGEAPSAYPQDPARTAVLPAHSQDPARTAVLPAHSQDPARTAVLPAYSQDPVRAAAYFDSLAQARPADPSSAYWSARAWELAGNRSRAYCGYLRLGALIPEEKAGRLASARRLALERRWADALAAEGSPRDRAAVSPRGPLLVLPPDNLGSPEDDLFAVTWTYLLFDALRRSGVCVLPPSVTLAAQEVLAGGGAVRVPTAVAAQPVNTVEGIRGRLSLLRALDGEPFTSSPGGGWDENLERALIRFQQERGIPPTGEADLVTQGRIQAAVETWLLRLPPPLDPKDLPRIASWLGAGAVVRGTYREEGARYTLQAGLLDSDGTAGEMEPVLLTVDPEQAGRAAQQMAFLLSQALGIEPLAAPVEAPSPSEFDPVITSLLLFDRGMPQLAEQRWSNAPSSWFDWRLLADLRRAGAVRAIEIAAWEEDLRREWNRRPELDPEAALNRFLTGLGQPGPGSGALAWPDPGPGRVLGSEGILRIRGEVQ